ncbi:unnamed protein product [Aphanomyces euteiches]
MEADRDANTQAAPREPSTMVSAGRTVDLKAATSTDARIASKREASAGHTAVASGVALQTVQRRHSGRGIAGLKVEGSAA